MRGSLLFSFVLAAFMLGAVASSRAAVPSPFETPTTPLRAAQRCESLTEGGPFNPARVHGWRGNNAASGTSQFAMPSRATSLYHNLW